MRGRARLSESKTERAYTDCCVGYRFGLRAERKGRPVDRTFVESKGAVQSRESWAGVAGRVGVRVESMWLGMAGRVGTGRG